MKFCLNDLRLFIFLHCVLNCIHRNYAVYLGSVGKCEKHGIAWVTVFISSYHNRKIHCYQIVAPVGLRINKCSKCVNPCSGMRLRNVTPLDVAL